MNQRRVVTFRPLLGFSMARASLALDDFVQIRRLDRWELDKIVEGDLAADIRAVWIEPHNFGASYEDPLGDSGLSWNAEDPAESVINCLRMTKGGRIAGAELVDVKFHRRRTLDGVEVHLGLSPKYVYNIPWAYELKPQEMSKLVHIWPQYQAAIRQAWFREAILRFGESYERVDDFHRATDLVIAMETVLPNPSETRRIPAVEKAKQAALVGFGNDPRYEDAFKALRHMQDLRNTVVHGGQLDQLQHPTPDEFDLAEEAIRRSIRLAAALLSQGVDWKPTRPSDGELIQWAQGN